MNIEFSEGILRRFQLIAPFRLHLYPILSEGAFIITIWDEGNGKLIATYPHDGIIDIRNFKEIR